MMGQKQTWTVSFSYSLQGLQHDDAVSSDHLRNDIKDSNMPSTDGATSDTDSSSRGTNHHADAVLLPSRTHLQSLVHHQVHEGVEPSQDALNMSASVQLHCNTERRLLLWANSNEFLVTLIFTDASPTPTPIRSTLPLNMNTENIDEVQRRKTFF